MPTINVNGVPVDYPDVGDVDWGTNATNFAIYVAAALGKIGQSDPPQTNDITISPGNLSVTSGNLSVGGTTTLTGNLTSNGNNNLGNASGDTTAITGILNVDSGVLYVDPTSNFVGINDTTPSQALDVTGNALVSGTLGVTGVITGASATLTDLTVDTNLIKTISASNFVGINTTTPTKALDVTGEILVSSDITIGGVLIADDSTNVTTAPPITFTGDTNTGIGRSAADTLDLITNGNSRFRLESTGQIKAVYESQVGTDYNTTLHNGYLCRAWVFADSSSAVQASGNVSTITDNGTGDYTVNYTVAMPDANYAESIGIGSPSPNVTGGTVIAEMRSDGSKSASSIRFTVIVISSGTKADEAISLMVFR